MIRTTKQARRLREAVLRRRLGSPVQWMVEAVAFAYGATPAESEQVWKSIQAMPATLIGMPISMSSLVKNQLSKIRTENEER